MLVNLQVCSLSGFVQKVHCIILNDKVLAFVNIVRVEYFRVDGFEDSPPNLMLDKASVTHLQHRYIELL